MGPLPQRPQSSCQPVLGRQHGPRRDVASGWGLSSLSAAPRNMTRPGHVKSGRVAHAVTSTPPLDPCAPVPRPGRFIRFVSRADRATSSASALVVVLPWRGKTRGDGAGRCKIGANPGRRFVPRSRTLEMRGTVQIEYWPAQLPSFPAKPAQLGQSDLTIVSRVRVGVNRRRHRRRIPGRDERSGPRLGEQLWS